MTETSEQLLSAVRNYVTDLFTKQVDPNFVFHNLEHTEDVVEACSHMADRYHLSDEDRLVLILAAWFHDTGYSKGEATGHEDESVKIATAFLIKNNVDENLVQRVSSCIEATRMPQSPVNLVEKILCDADLYHLATDDFRARSQLLKQEQESILGHKIDKKEWRKNNISFLENHKYFTDLGRDKLELKKMENLMALKKKKQVKAIEEKEEKVESFPYFSDPSVDGKDEY
jgi:HD superfamily phosphodiesterase